MKYTIVFAGFAAFVATQKLDDLFDELPTCAQTCPWKEIINAGCAPGDMKCIFVKPFLITNELSACISKACPEKKDMDVVNCIDWQICTVKEFACPFTTASHVRDDVEVIASPTPLPHALHLISPDGVQKPITTTDSPSYTYTITIVPDSSPIPSLTEGSSCIGNTITISQTQTVVIMTTVTPYPTPSASVTASATDKGSSIKPSMPEYTGGVGRMGAGVATGVAAGLVGVVGLIL